MAVAKVRVCVEEGSKRIFASALDWPGWCRSAKNEAEALLALAAYAPRYERVAEAAGLPFPRDFDLDVVERVPGNMTTDFGAPAIVAKGEAEPLKAADSRRLGVLMRAAWGVLDGVATSAPAELRKGPRGGGRDTAQLIEHVHGAEDAYGRKVGVKVKDPLERRAAFVAVLEGGQQLEGGWPPRYAARRAAWHALDHAWEIEDKSE